MEISVKEKKLRFLNENSIQNLLIQQKCDETSLRFWPETVETVDASGNQIEDISLHSAKNLKRLILKRNYLKTLQGIPSSVIELDLSHNMLCQLSYISPGNDLGFISKLSSFYNLEIIDLSNNKITFLEANSFAKNLKLKNVNLSNNFIKSGLKALSHLSDLERLDLSSNSLEDLNSFSIFNGKLPKLMNLNLKNNPCIIKNQNKYGSFLNGIFPTLVKLNEMSVKRTEQTPGKVRKNISTEIPLSTRNTPQKNLSAYKTIRKRSLSNQYSNLPLRNLELNLSKVKTNIESAKSCKSLHTNFDPNITEETENNSKYEGSKYYTPRGFSLESVHMKDQITSFISILHNNITPSKNKSFNDASDKLITTIETLSLVEKTDSAAQTEVEEISALPIEMISFDLNTKAGGEQYLIQEQNRLLRDYHNQLDAYRKKIDTLEKRDDERKKCIEDFKTMIHLFATDKPISEINIEKIRALQSENYKNEMSALLNMMLCRLEKQSVEFDDIMQIQESNKQCVLNSIIKAEQELDTSIIKLKSDFALIKESILVQNKKLEDILTLKIQDLKRVASQLEPNKLL